jgi:DHA2 family multidrug resistance protein-like MFS transporter
VFLVALPVTLLLLALGPRVLPEFRDPDATGFDLLGAAQSLVALLAVVYAIKRAAGGASPVPAVAAAGIGLVLGAAFVRRQRRSARPIIDPDLFRGPGVRIALVSTSLTFFALYGTQVAVAQYLQWVLGLSPLRAGLWTLPGTLAYLAGTAIGPVAVSRFPPVRVIAAGLLVAASGCALLTGHELVFVVAGTMVFGFGLAPVYTLSTDLIVSAARPSRAGTAGAVGETSAELGGALGIALLGSLGVAVYRAGGATGSAAGLPRNQAAFEHAYVAIAGAATVTLLVALAAVLLLSRPTAEARRHRSAVTAGRT